MRKLLPLVLLLFMAGSVEAQQQTQPASPGDVPAVDQRPAQVTGPVNQKTGALDLRTVEPERLPTDEASAGVLAEAVNGTAAGDVLRQDPTTRNWWYLVGAIVVGGIILAVIL
jgi:hypothetical protein